MHRERRWVVVVLLEFSTVNVEVFAHTHTHKHTHTHTHTHKNRPCNACLYAGRSSFTAESFLT